MRQDKTRQRLYAQFFRQGDRNDETWKRRYARHM